MENAPYALIIDDEDIGVKAASKKLKSLGHRFEVAKNQEEALKYVDSCDFDYILLDLKLKVDEDDIDPDSTVGFIILNRVREKREKETLPIIVMTAYERTIDVAVEAMKNGANDFLEKPFKTGALEKCILDVLKGKSAELVLCLQELPQNRKHKNFFAEIVINPGKGEDERPLRVGKAMLRFFHMTLSARIQGLTWVESGHIKGELQYDDSSDRYWFSKRINYIKTWLDDRDMSQYFEFDESGGRENIKIRTILEKDQVRVNIPDYERAKAETAT